MLRLTHQIALRASRIEKKRSVKATFGGWMLASMWKLLVQKILIKFKNFSTPNCGRLGVPGWDSFLILGGYGPISKIIEKGQFRVLSETAFGMKITA